MNQEGPIGWQARTLRSWHLAILRFALTLDNADRLGVFAIAREIGGLHRPHDERMDFDFFRRTSTELCEAILQPNKTGAETICPARARSCGRYQSRATGAHQAAVKGLQCNMARTAFAP
jgi:hypothetical protein